MKKHTMKLYPQCFELVKSGRKTIELRLLDEKRKAVKEGDVISFSNTETGECIDCVCLELFYADSFVELFEQIGDNEACGSPKDATYAEMAQEMRAYYSEEAERKFGVVGIKIAECVAAEMEDIITLTDEFGEETELEKSVRIDSSEDKEEAI